MAPKIETRADTRLPNHFPDLNTFLTVTNAVRNNGFENELPPVSDAFVSSVRRLLTPDDLLRAKKIDHPEIISKINYPNFDFLLWDRERIRTLRLLPKKLDVHYVSYLNENQERLKQIASDYTKKDNFAVELNLFPDYLPLDLEEYTIWIRNPDTKQDEIARFVAQVMNAWNIGLDEVILFEKPPKAETKFVAPTVPELRHVHFWIKAKDKKTSLHRLMYKRAEGV